VHRLCAVVLVLSSFCSVQAQDVSLEALDLDDCVGKIMEPTEQSTNSIPTHVVIPTAVAPIGPTESTTTEPSKEELTRIIERILDEAMQRGDECLVASIDGAEKTWSGENLGASGKLTDIVEQSSPAQIVPNEPTGKQAEREFLNSFSQDLEE